MIVTIAEYKAHNYIEHNEFDPLLTGYIEAAQDHVERVIGYKFAETYGGTDQDPVPPALKQAVILLASHWWENRAAASGENALRQVPLGVADILREYRNWSWS